jgi:positive regulator of sigma E activity
MDKLQLLQEIKMAGQKGELTEAEMLGALRGGASVDIEKEESKFNLSTLMYYIGGAIIFIGIVVLLFQNWERFSDTVKILVTLGSAIVAYVVGVLLHKKEGLTGASQSMFLVSLLVLPIGVHVTLDKLGLEVASNSSQVLIAGLLLAIALASFAAFRRLVFTLFSVIFATWLFHFILALLFSDTFLETTKLIQYELLVVGLAYMLLGYYFSNNTQKSLAGVLYAFGSLGFLGAALASGGRLAHFGKW